MGLDEISNTKRLALDVEGLSDQIFGGHNFKGSDLWRVRFSEGHDLMQMGRSDFTGASCAKNGILRFDLSPKMEFFDALMRLSSALMRLSSSFSWQIFGGRNFKGRDLMHDVSADFLRSVGVYTSCRRMYETQSLFQGPRKFALEILDLNRCGSITFARFKRKTYSYNC
jgi:hypothetical protein